MRIVVPLSLTILIFLILELQTNNAAPTNAIKNIRKVLALFQNYQRAYHYSNKNTFWTRNRDQTGIDDVLYQEECYIHYQAKYGRNFVELHSIFITQILTLIYAWKFKQRETRLRISFPNEENFPESKVYTFFTLYGTETESVYPDEDFGLVAFAFHNFREKLRHLIQERSIDLEVLDSQFKREMQEDASVLVTYIKNTLLQIPEDSLTGFGIDIMTHMNLPLDMGPFQQIIGRNPNLLFENHDSGRRDLVKSVAIEALEWLIYDIASFIGLRTGAEARQDIKSFILLEPDKETPDTLIIVEIPFDFLSSYFPEPNPVSWSTGLTNWAYDNFPFILY